MKFNRKNLLIISIYLLFYFLIYQPNISYAERYNFIKYTNQEGLSSSQITSIVQDKDGYLWLATIVGGVNRFDGVSFKVYKKEEGLDSTLVRKLLFQDDVLYAATESGLFKKTDDKFSYIEPKDKAILIGKTLSANKSLGLFFGTTDGLYHLNKDGILEKDFRSPQLPSQNISNIQIDNQNNLWVQGKLFLGYFENDEFISIKTADDLKLSNILPNADVINNKNVKLWVATNNGLYYVSSENKLEFYNISNNLLQNVPIQSLFLDKTQRLWVSTKKGIFIVDFNKKELKDNISYLTTNEGGPREWVRSFYQDLDGNLFLGTDGEGLYHLPPLPFYIQNISEIDNYAPTGVITDRYNRKWFATIDQGLFYIKDGKTTRITEKDGFYQSICFALKKDNNGTIWVATDNGLYNIVLQGDDIKVNKIGGILETAHVKDILIIDNILYLGTSENSLVVFDGKNITSFDEKFGIKSKHIVTITIKDSNHLWLGSVNMGVFLWDIQNKKVVQHITTKEGLPADGINSVFHDTTTNKTWIGTEFGLAVKTKDKIDIISTKNHLPDDSIHFIVQDPKTKNIWVGTNRGVALQETRQTPTSSSTIDDNSNWQVFGYRQGLPNEETNIQGALFDSDNILWIGTSTAYAVLNPSALYKKIPPPILHLLEVHSELDSQNHIKDQDPIFDYNNNSIKFSFSGISYTDPKGIKYKYKISGLDNKWIETTAREVRYPSIPSGKYTFEIMAGNHQNIWTDVSIKYPFSIKPPFWETWWFKTIQTFSIFGIGIAIYSIRARNLKKQKKILEKMVEERTAELFQEKEKSEKLLLNILPESIANELKKRGDAITRLYPDVTVLFTDFQGFTKASEKISPQDLVLALNEIFAKFDSICQKHNMEKLKTIGDAYMAAGGLPKENLTHPTDAVAAAIEMQDYLFERNQSGASFALGLRIGIHTGPVVAGIIGTWKFAYDIWGDAVNTASRMESSGVAGEVNLSRSTYDRVKDVYICEARGQVLAKGKGALEMFFIRGKKNQLQNGKDSSSYNIKELTEVEAITPSKENPKDDLLQKIKN